MKTASRFAILVLALVVCVFAQTSSTPTSSPGPTAASPSSVTAGLGLADTEKVGIAVPVLNPTGSALQIMGVQASGDLFIESFPSSIPAGGAANLTAIYYDTGSTSGGTDIVRVLTSAGPIVIPVSHGRPQVVTLSANSLSWDIGDTGTKSVTITITGGAAVPTTARALGIGNSASITSLGSGTYQVTVQPGNAAQANRFPVMVDLSPVLPDVTIAIYCTVGLSQG